jgi:EmrB/QacA subfamily drug resistance transporter
LRTYVIVMAGAASLLGVHEARGRWVLAATVLGSGMASLDATVVNIALPTIAKDLGGGLAALQWIVNGYTLALASLLLVGGSLGDRYGRRRVFVVGVAWFMLASFACALVRTTTALIAARVLQGAGAALLTPGSLAIIEASFRRDERAAAIAAWSGLGGVAIAAGPFVGGYLIQAVSWRLLFLLNLPLAIIVILVAERCVPESRDRDAGPIDLGGAVLGALGLGGVTYALMEAPARGRLAPDVIVAAVLCVAALILFVVVEARRTTPILDLRLFRRRPFGAANAETFILYAALGGALFLLPIQLQTVLGWSPLEAGAALLPATGMMLLLSSVMGRLAQRIGPRVPMTLGPLVAAFGLALLARIRPGAGYARDVLPGAIALGIGLGTTVAPLTATVLAAAPEERAGLASAINNWVARTGGLLAVALLPAAAGLGDTNALDSAHFSAGYARGMALAALGCVVAGLIAAARVRAPCAAAPQRGVTCPLDSPPLRQH